MHDPEAIYANLDSVGSQTNHYCCHELDCYISSQNEITGGCVVDGIAFCGIFATGDDGWKDALIPTWYISQITVLRSENE